MTISIYKGIMTCVYTLMLLNFCFLKANPSLAVTYFIPVYNQVLGPTCGAILTRSKSGKITQDLCFGVHGRVRLEDSGFLVFDSSFFCVNHLFTASIGFNYRGVTFRIGSFSTRKPFFSIGYNFSCYAEVFLFSDFWKGQAISSNFNSESLPTNLKPCNKELSATNINTIVSATLPNELLEDDSMSLADSLQSFNQTLFSDSLNQKVDKIKPENCAALTTIKTINEKQELLQIHNHGFIKQSPLFTHSNNFSKQGLTSYKDKDLEKNYAKKCDDLYHQVSSLKHEELEPLIESIFELSLFMSDAYVKSLENTRDELKVKSENLQCYTAALRSRNFKQNNIHYKETPNGLYSVYSVDLGDGKNIKIDNLRFFNNMQNSFVKRYQQEHQIEKILLFLSVVDKLKYSGYTSYESQDRFETDLYAFQLLSYMTECNVLQPCAGDANTNAFEQKLIEVTNNTDFANKVSKKTALAWLAEYNQVKGNKEKFFNNVMKKCTDLYILDLLVKIQYDEQNAIREIGENSVLDLHYDRYLDGEAASVVISNGKINLFNEYLEMKALKKTLKKSDPAEIKKMAEKVEKRFSCLQLYYAIYKILKQEKKKGSKKEDFIQQQYQKTLAKEEVMRSSKLAQSKTKESSSFLMNLLDRIGGCSVPAKLNRRILSKNYFATSIYRVPQIVRSIKKSLLRCVSYQGFQLEDFAFYFLANDKSFLLPRANTYRSNEILFSLFCFHDIYYRIIVDVNKLRTEFYQVLAKPQLKENELASFQLQFYKSIENKIKDGIKKISKEEHEKILFYQNPSVSIYADAYIKNLKSILCRFEVIKRLVMNHPHDLAARITAINAMIYPDMLTFASDWKFLMEDMKRERLSRLLDSVSMSSCVVESGKKCFYVDGRKMYVDERHQADLSVIIKKRQRDEEKVLNALSSCGHFFDKWESFVTSELYFNYRLLMFVESYRSEKSRVNRSSNIDTIFTSLESLLKTFPLYKLSSCIGQTLKTQLNNKKFSEAMQSIEEYISNKKIKPIF